MATMMTTTTTPTRHHHHHHHYHGDHHGGGGAAAVAVATTTDIVVVAQQKEELTAMAEWLSTFPQLESFPFQKSRHQDEDNDSNNDSNDNNGSTLFTTATTTTKSSCYGSVYLSKESIARTILDIVVEVCSIDKTDVQQLEMRNTSRGDDDDDELVWDMILSLTRKSIPKLRKSLQPSDDPLVVDQDLTNSWVDHNKYFVLSNLLSVAVSHRDLMLRKTYIERIMTLSTPTQRVLMSLIEQRKKASSSSRSSRNKTPSKKQEGQRYRSTTTTTTPSSTRSTTRNGGSNSRSGELDKYEKNFASIDNGTSMSLDDSLSIPTPPPKTGTKSNLNDRDLVDQEKDTRSSSRKLSPFRVRRLNDPKNARIPSSTSKSKPEGPNSISKAKRGGFLSTPNFLKRSSTNQGGNDDDCDSNGENVDDTRRSFHDAFGSPTPQRTAKRLPPPSSERSLQMNRSVLSSPGFGGDVEYERVVEEMRDEIETLKKKLEASQKKETELAKSVDEKDASFKLELIKVERDARHRFEEAREGYEQRITQVNGKLSQLSDELVKVSNERDELSKLRDEMDVMAHTKATLEETQERLNAYKEKVHQLADVKSALKEEEEAHSRCVEENLKLRNEIQTLLPLKRQLEEYQARLADAEVQITDYQDQLAKIRDQKLASSDVNEQMEQYVMAQEEELQELRRRVRLGEVSSESNENIAFIGEGLSELNPELKEELMRLRNENEQLRIFREKRGDDNVSKLEQDVGDKSRLAERYKTQFLSTKDQLESTQRSLQESRGREAKLRNDLAESMTKIQERQEEIEDLSGQVHKAQEELSSSQQRESKLEDELSSWASEAKNLQEHSNDLSRRLKKHEAWLEDSQKREADLSTDLERVKAELEQSIEQNNTLAEEFEDCTIQLEEAEKRGQELSEEVKEWTQRAQESHSRAEEITAQLMSSNNDLEIEKSERSNLEAKFSLLKEESNEKISNLSEELNSTLTLLKESMKNFEDATEREKGLRNDIVDLTCRAEDAEGVSKQRMELVQTTRDKLQSVESKLNELEEVHQQTLASLASWTSRAEEAELNSKTLDEELEEIRRNLNDTEEKLSESQGLVDHLKIEIDALSVEKEDWMKQAAEAQDLVNRLRGEVEETTNNLLLVREDKNILHNQTMKLAEELLDTQNTLTKLENEIEAQEAAREEETKKLKKLESEHSHLTKEWTEEKIELKEELEKNREQRKKLEHELTTANESLNEMQVTMGSLQHREKMLKHDITKLTDTQLETELKLSDTERKLEQVQEESKKSIDSLQELLAARSEEEIEEIKQNMNKLLDDERNAKRQTEELHKKQLDQINQKHQEELASAEKKWNEELNNLRTETEKEIKRMKREHDDLVFELRNSAHDEKAKLMDQGKGMLKEHQKKIQSLQDDVDFLESKISELEDEKKVNSKEWERKGKLFQSKIGEYKKKLQEAASRNTILARNLDEAKDKITSLSREKIKLTEDNDRYRRQLGGRSGTDSVLQTQLEAVQKELHDADEEIKELKRKLRNDGYNGLSSISEESTGYGLRSGAKSSTLAQQRAEYEETIMTLKDEMRGHVMEKTSLITAAQSESKRAWEVEQQLSDLKKQTTSLQLEKARLEKLLQDDDRKVTFASFSEIPNPPSIGNDSDEGQDGDEVEPDEKEMASNPPKVMSPEKYAVAEDDQNLSFNSSSDIRRTGRSTRATRSTRSMRSLNSEPNNDWM